MDNNYIEFYFDKEENFCAELYINGKSTLVKKTNDLEKLLEICYKYGYIIENEGTIHNNVSLISEKFQQYLKETRKQNLLKIFGNISDKMILVQKNPLAMNTIIAGTLAAFITMTNIGSNVNTPPIAHNTSNSSVSDKDIEDEDTQSSLDGTDVIIDISKKEDVYETDEKKEQVSTDIEANNAIEEHQVTQEVEKNDVKQNQGVPIQNEEHKEKEKQKIQEKEGKQKKELEDMMKTDTFHFYYSEKADSESLRNAKRYEDIFEQYAEQYGLDKNLLIAMAAQESGGDHQKAVDNGDASAQGVMQIEKAIHIGEDIKAYNFVTKDYDSVHIAEENLQDLDANIQIGAMILRNYLEQNDFNIPLALQTYNLGPNNMSESLEMCSDLEGISKKEICSNPENNIWLKYRSFLGVGDPKYVEHVFNFLDNDSVITIKKNENEIVSIKVSNDYKKEKNKKA